MKYSKPEMEVIVLDFPKTYLVSGGETEDDNKVEITWPTQPTGDGW